MATPPRIGDAELAAMLDRIRGRHRKVDDPHLHHWEHEPRAALDYLTRYSVPGRVPRWVAQADAYDAVVLLAWLWWDDRRRERAILRRGLAVGLFPSQLGAPLGITTRQGLRDRLDRLDALTEVRRPDEKHARAARAAGHGRDQTHRAWLADQRERITDLAAALVAAAEDHRIDDREFCDELATELAEPTGGAAAPHGPGAGHPPAEELPASILALLGLAAAELRTDPAVLELPARHPVHRLVRDVESLRAEAARAG